MRCFGDKSLKNASFSPQFCTLFVEGSKSLQESVPPNPKRCYRELKIVGSLGHQRLNFDDWELHFLCGATLFRRHRNYDERLRNV